MRPFSALVLGVALLATSPLLAQGNLDDMGSEQQAQGYGKLFGYVCGVVALGIIIIGGVQIAKGMMAESARGKKVSVFTDILEEDTVKNKTKKREIPLYLGEKVPDWKIQNRLAATKAALTFLGKTDEWWQPKMVGDFARAAFLTVKEGITARASKKMARQLTEKCFEGIKAEIEKLKKNSQFHVLDRMEIEEIRVVHFEAPAGKTNHKFTALISASSRDFFKDEKSGEVVRGDKKLYEYQEFWQFVRTKEMWLVERIRSAEDMDRILEPKNVMTEADLERFAKKADPAHLREFVAK